MTVTDSQRRKIASALRGDPNDTLIPQSRDGFEGMTYHEAAFRFWNMCRRVSGASNVDIAYSTTSVLADLIDPTCYVVSTISYDWSDGTEYAHKLSCNHTCYTDCPEPPAYCCKCGCRVVEEDNSDQ